MGVRERRERERQELRRAILDAAGEIAAAEGWLAVTIRRVAEKIEYSPPTIYECFESKEQIVIELLRQGFRQMLAAMRAARDRHTDPIEAVVAIGKAYWEFSLTHPEMHPGMHGETAFEACAGRAFAAGHATPGPGHAAPDAGKDVRGQQPSLPPRHMPFEEVHDREEWLGFFKSPAPQIPPNEPFPETREIFLTVRDALERALGGGQDLESLSWKVVTVWGTTHGLISLAMAGMIPNGREVGGQLVEKMHRDLLAMWRAETTSWHPTSVTRESTRAAHDE